MLRILLDGLWDKGTKRVEVQGWYVVDGVYGGTVVVFSLWQSRFTVGTPLDSALPEALGTRTLSVSDLPLQ